MKKLNSKFKIFLGLLGVTSLLISTVFMSAIACSSKSDFVNKDKIIISVQPQAQTIYLNQTQNLPTLSFQATISDKNAKLTYQWYESDTNSSTSGKQIPNATQSTYMIPKSYAQKVQTKYFYAVINVVKNNNVLNSFVSSVAAVTITDKLPSISIITQPVNQTAVVNQSENLPTLSVVASSINAAKLTYQWYSNTNNSIEGATKIPNATNPEYRIIKSDVEMVGSKYFFVKIDGSFLETKLTQINSNIISLSVDALPVINISNNLQNLDMVVGQKISLPKLSVNASSINGVKLTYQWYESDTNSTTNGKPILGATRSTHTLSKANAQKAGIKYFYVKVSGSFYGSALTPATSNVATLTVNNLPKITDNSAPQRLYATVGQTTNLPTFYTRATTNNPKVILEYQWYKNGAYIYGANNPSYKVPASGATSAGQKRYYCYISGSLYGESLLPISTITSILTVNNLPK